MAAHHTPSSNDQTGSSAESARQTLYQVMADDDLTLAEKRSRVLDLGREYLGVENGHIERWDPTTDSHQVVDSVGGGPDLFPVGETLDRATTYCRRTMASAEPVATADATADGWGSDPAYQKHGLECYLGAPIFIRGETYGTVCFVDEAAREQSFSSAEKAFVELAARLLGRELEPDGHESELSAVRKQYESLVAAAPDAIFLVDAETGEIAEANEAAVELTGYDAERLESLRVTELHPPDRRVQYERLFEDLRDAEQTTSSLPDGSQLELRTADGELVPIELSATSVVLPDGEYVQGIVRDISERVRRRAELDRERELFAHSQQLAGIGGWEYDCRTDDLYWTDEVRRIHGLDEGYQPDVDDALSFYHPEDRPEMEAAVQRAIEDGEPYDVELRIVRTDGEVRWVRAQGRPTVEDGETVRLRGTVHDITDRKEREETLRLRTRAMDEAGVGISIADATRPDEPLVYVNDAFAELTGYDRETALGVNCRFLQGEATEESSVDTIREGIENQETRTTELLNYRADGTPFWNELTVTPVTDDDGGTTHFIGIQRDVTERKRRERLVGVLNRLLRHNLRNDMTVVGGLAEVIAEQATGDVAEHAETIGETAANLVAVSEKAQAVETAIRDDSPPEELDVTDLVADVVDSLREKYPDASLAVEMPPTQTAVATMRLRRVIEELVDNAVAYAGSSPTVEVAVVPPAEDDDRVCIEVRDDGPGLPAAEQRVLQQASETSLDHGNSFGLWLVNWLVTEMGGEVEVRVEDGTTIGVLLRQSTGDGRPDREAGVRSALGHDPESAGW